VKAGVLPISVTILTTVFAVIACIAITNTTLVAVVTQPRILYGMAREDVVPGVFAKIHATRRSPWVGLLFCASVVMLLLVIGNAVTAAGGEDIVARLATVTVALTLFIYMLVIGAALKLKGVDETDKTFKAPTWLLGLGIVGNLVLLVYVIVTDPTSLLWCAGLIAVGGVLFVVEYFFGRRNRDDGEERGDPEIEPTHTGI